MAAFNINSGSVTRWETLTGGSVNATLDTYAISAGSTLLIDTDTYQCLNHSLAFGSLDTVSWSGIGGTLKFDPTGVRVVAYTGGTGNAPAIGATITQGGVSATLLGVWATWQVEPTAAGAAMPATGFIKVRAKTGGDFAAGALTGIGATASGADVQGWLEARGADTATITASRIARIEIVKAWFDLGTTNGTRGQFIQCPTTGVIAGTFPACWVETAAGSGIYRKFVNANSQVALATTPTDERAYQFWQTTAGLRFGSDGTNNVGFLPPTGCKVRIPAVIQTTCTRTAGGSGARVLPNGTLATRQELVTTGAAYIDMQGVVTQWYMNLSQAFYTKLQSCAIADTLVLSEVSSALDIDDVVVAPTQAQINLALNLGSCFGGGNIRNSRFTRFSLASSGSYAGQGNYCKGVDFDDVTFDSLTLRANGTTGVFTATQMNDSNFTNCIGIGGRFLFNACQDVTVTDLQYADSLIATTATNPFYAVDFGTASKNCKVVRGKTLGALANVHPYNGWVNSANSYNITMQEVGTYATPFNCGSANAMGVGFNGAGNNDGLNLKRNYFINTRTGPYAFLNSDNNVLIQDHNGDVADTSVLACLNGIAKGVRLTSATSGQVSVYGTHWIDRFVSNTAGFIEILCNEPTALSAAQCSIIAGTPQFNSSGSVLLTSAGQEVQWEMPYFALKHTALANLAPVLTGTNTGNLTYTFQYDKTKTGYNGSWLTLNAANLNAVGVIDPAIGIKIKVRAVCTVANAGNILTNIRINTISTSAAQSDNLYPLDIAPITVTGLASGSRVKFTKTSDGTFLYQAPEIGGIVSFSENIYVGSVTITVRKASAAPFYKEWITQVVTVGGSTVSAIALQDLDT